MVSVHVVLGVAVIVVCAGAAILGFVSYRRAQVGATVSHALVLAQTALIAQAVADPHPDRDDGQHDRGVEQAPVPLRPRFEVSPPLAPDEEEEERDREEERDPHDSPDGRQHGLKREHDDDQRREGDDAEPADERRDPLPVLPEASHPVMNARTASAPATSVVPANQRSRRGPSSGA